MPVNPLQNVSGDVVDVTGSASAGAVTAVTASAPLASSNGTTPNITMTSPLPLVNGGSAADLSATGGAKNYVKQAGVGSALTVGTIPAGDVGTGAVLADGTVPLTANYNASAGQTTTPYSIQYRNSVNWYNVLAYGADNTGATDTTAAVQAAITACSAGGGGVVYFPQGTYKIVSTLNVSSTGMTFLGVGREGNAQITNSSTLLLPAAADGFNITLANATPVQFRDLSFDTTTQAAGTSGAFIHANSAASFPLYVERCKFWDHFNGILM